MRDTDWKILSELHKTPNMTKVASMVSMSQPSLSKRLKHMEAEFGMQIINREKTGLYFTKAGEYLAKQAERYLSLQRETQEMIRQMKSEEETIRVGSAYTYSKFQLTDVIADYMEVNPHSGIQVVNEKSNVLFRRILDESLDISFVRGDYEGSVNRILVAKDQAYIVTRDPFCPKQLEELPMIDYETNDKTSQLIDAWWSRKMGEHVESVEKSAITVKYLDLAWNMVREGVGYLCCFLPEDFKNRDNLYLTPLLDQEDKPVSRNTWCIYPKGKSLSGNLERFIQYIQANVAL